MAKNFELQERINRILDKISESGYDSLTKEEKAQLENPEIPVVHVDMYEKTVESETLQQDEKTHEWKAIAGNNEGCLVINYVNKLLGKRTEKCVRKHGVLCIEIYEKNMHLCLNIFNTEVENEYLMEVPRALFLKIWDEFPYMSIIKNIKTALRKWCEISDDCNINLVLVENLK